MSTIRLIAYSDYLCPWCYNASVRLHRLQEELDGAIEIDWRSYLLRPRPSSRRDLEKFRDYTKSWLRPASDEDAGHFRVWQSDEGPPSHSVPAQLAAKAAARLGRPEFRRMHDRLLRAYFTENRDISRREVLLELWCELGFEPVEFAHIDDGEMLERVVAEHNEAIELGISAVPAVRSADGEGAVIGAQPLDLYRRWIDRLRSA